MRLARLAADPSNGITQQTPRSVGEKRERLGGVPTPIVIGRSRCAGVAHRKGALDHRLENVEKPPELGRKRKVFVFLSDAYQFDATSGRDCVDDGAHLVVGGRGAGGDPNDLRFVQPRGVDAIRSVDTMRCHPALPGDPDERLCIRGVLRADHEDQIASLGKSLDGALTVGGGETEIGPACRPQIRVPRGGFIQHAFPFVEAESGLSQQGDTITTSCAEPAKAVGRIHERHRGGGLGDDSNRLIVALVADVDDVEALVGHALDLMVHLGDERADGIDRHRGSSVCRGDHLWRRAVSRQHHRPPFGNICDVVDEDHADAFEHVDDRGVVDDLVVAVHRGFEDLDHPGQRLDRHLDAGAETSGLGKEHLLWHEGQIMRLRVAPEEQGEESEGALLLRVAMSGTPTILEVVAGSPADTAGIAVGDRLLAVNDVVPSDVIEYQHLIDDPDPELRLQRGGEEWVVVPSKRAGEPVGLRLGASIFDRVQTCDNHCEFCFIYQLPPGMRKSLYLKDDDYRLSFLYGNFTTLTRFTEFDLFRVVEERLGPLYVSIHATEPAIRADMLRNPRGATSLRWLRALLDAGVEVHGQVVLCPGINDAAVFERTCAEIIARYGELRSVGVVPLGLSRFNTEARLRVHTEQDAQRDLAIVHRWQDAALERTGRRIFFASDELYLRGNVPIPQSDAYETFSQHENGIGMVRTLYDEIERMEQGAGGELPAVTGEWRSVPSAPAEGYRAARHEEPDPDPSAGPIVIVTGEYGAKALAPVLDRLQRLARQDLRLLPVRNAFFGGNTAVSGLLVGSDVRVALETDRQAAGVYLLPDVALSGDRFLDDVALGDVAQAASAPVVAVEATAHGLVGAVAT